MKLDEDQIKLLDKQAGQTEKGDKIYYVLSKGGLHIFLDKYEGKTRVLAAAPHIGIARYFAEKKADSPIKWAEDYMLKSEDSQDSSNKFHQMRETFFKGIKLTDKPTYCVYNHNAYEFELMDKIEFKSALAKNEFSDYSFVRRMDKEEAPQFIIDLKD